MAGCFGEVQQCLVIINCLLKNRVHDNLIQNLLISPHSHQFSTLLRTISVSVFLKTNEPVFVYQKIATLASRFPSSY